MEKKKFIVVHYLNQFFGGIGGEDKADFAPAYADGPKGPGITLQKLFAEQAETAATIICGDNYFAEHTEKSLKEILFLIEGFKPNLIIAGPAFNAGRYGMACAEVCKTAGEKLKIPAITGLSPENPAVEIYKKSVFFIIPTRNSVVGMNDALKGMTRLSLKLLNNEALGPAEKEGYIPKGLRKNCFAPKTGAERAVEMLIAKISGGTIKTELTLPVFDKVKPLPPLEDLSKIKLCLITSGGIVPKGNPDMISSSSAQKFARYGIKDMKKLTTETHQTCHGGYDQTYANENPNRVLPLDVMRDLEREGVIGKLHDFYYATVGNGTSVANARKFAQEIAAELKEAQVSAVILTST